MAKNFAIFLVMLSIALCYMIGSNRLGIFSSGYAQQSPKGTPSPTPWPSNDCCARANADGLNKNGDQGGVICCNGQPTSCAWGDKFPSDTQETHNNRIECTILHENDHHDDIVPCPPGDSAISRPGGKPGANPDQYECEAHAKSQECMKEKYDQCQTAECKRLMKHYYDSGNKTRSDYCNRLNPQPTPFPPITTPSPK